VTLRQKLFQIQTTIDKFQKDGQGNNFKYIKGEQILSIILPKMNELKIMLEPHLTGPAEFYQVNYLTTLKLKGTKEDPIWYGKPATDVVLTTPGYFVWVDVETGEEIKIPWVFAGQQADVSQAEGSGLTYNERYFLMKYFHIQTDADDPDARRQNIVAEFHIQTDADDPDARRQNIVAEEETITYLSQALFDSVIAKRDIEYLRKVYAEYSTSTKIMLPQHKKVFDNIIEQSNKK